MVFQNGQRTWTLHQRKQQNRQEGPEKVLIIISHHYSERPFTLPGKARFKDHREIIEHLGTFTRRWGGKIMWTFWSTLDSAHEALSQKKWKPMFPKRFYLITAAISITQTWRHSKYPSAEEWINNFWYIHTMEYYSVRRKKLLITDNRCW